MPVHMKHEFIGEAQGNALAEWLNQKGHKAERERIVELIGALKALGTAVEDVLYGNVAKINTAGTGKRRFVPRSTDLKAAKRYGEVLHHIDRLLSDCWMRPQVDYDGTRYSVTWKYQKPRSEGAHLLIRLMELGVVGRIRTCAREGCGKWLFTTYPTKRFCSGDCQRRDYQNSEEWKRRRRLKYQAGRRRRA
jgi:hypothetical protein